MPDDEPGETGIVFSAGTWAVWRMGRSGFGVWDESDPENNDDVSPEFYSTDYAEARRYVVDKHAGELWDLLTIGALVVDVA